MHVTSWSRTGVGALQKLGGQMGEASGLAAGVLDPSCCVAAYPVIQPGSPPEDKDNHPCFAAVLSSTRDELEGRLRPEGLVLALGTFSASASSSIIR